MVKLIKRLAPALLISVLVTALMGMVFNYGLLDGAESRIFNAKLRMRGQVPQTGNVAIAVIDERSVLFEHLGHWPWPRIYLGMLVEVLNENGAKVIGFDAFFPEPFENVSLYSMRSFFRYSFESMGLDQPNLKGRNKRQFLRNLNQYYDYFLGAEYERNPDADLEGDEVHLNLNPDILFANVLAKNDNVILGYFFGEPTKHAMYIKEINLAFSSIKVDLDVAKIDIPKWIAKDKDNIIGFIKDLEIEEKQHVPYKTLIKNVETFSSNFQIAAENAVEKSGNYENNAKMGISDFYSYCLVYILGDIHTNMSILMEQPDEEVLENLKYKYRGMEGSAVETESTSNSVNPFLHANDMTPNIFRLTEKTKHFGHVHVAPDSDGVIRHHYPGIYFGQRFFPSLGLKSASIFLGKTPKILLPPPGERPVLNLGETNVPLEDNGTLLINYFGPKRYKHYSIYDIIYWKIIGMPAQDSIPQYFEEVLKTTPEEYYKKEYGEDPLEGDIEFMLQDVLVEDIPLARHIVKWESEQFFEEEYGVSPIEAFKNKIVLIGSTATGAYDMRVTPFSENTPGVEIHATVIDSILTGNFVQTPPWSRNYTLGIMLVFALLMALVLPLMRALRGAVLTIILLVLLLAVDYFYFFLGYGYWLTISYQTIQLGGLFLLITLYRYATEEREKRFIKDTFGKYLAPAVVEHLTENPDLLQLGGDELELTAFFSDIQGFSSFSEQLTPKRLVDLLNDYLGEMAQVIEHYEGTIDKYEGDAIIAFWGAPLHFEDHALKTCYACLDQQARLADLREKWSKDGTWPELVQDIRVRMGVNTGPMVVGNMGSAGRMNYTMMGDAVNLAARLEGANKAYGTYLMIAEDTYAQVKDHVEVRELDKLRVVGKTEPVVVYHLLCRKGDMDPHTLRVVEVFLEGLGVYKQRDWQKAIDLFQTALNIDPDDGPSRAYLQRCKNYAVNPPPEDWGGVFTMTSKG